MFYPENAAIFPTRGEVLVIIDEAKVKRATRAGAVTYRPVCRPWSAHDDDDDVLGADPAMTQTRFFFA